MRALADIVRLRTADCRQAAARLPALAAGEPASRRAAGAACRAVPALPGGGGRLPAHPAPPAVLRDDEMPRRPRAPSRTSCEALAAAGLEDSAPGTNRILRAAYVGGITVATAAAGAAGVLVWMSRRRPGLAETG